SPTSTRRRSGWIITAFAVSSKASAATSTWTMPPTPKEVSRVPSVSCRTATKLGLPGVASPAPTTTMRPSPWSATACAGPVPPTSVVTVPPAPNDASRLPVGVKRRTVKPDPTTTIRPSGWIATPSPQSAPGVASIAVQPNDPNDGSRLASLARPTTGRRIARTTTTLVRMRNRSVRGRRYHRRRAGVNRNPRPDAEATGLSTRRVTGVDGTSRLASRAVPRATWNGALLAESERCVVVEGNRYFPAETVKREHLRPSATHTTCAWKGVASYYDVVVN